MLARMSSAPFVQINGFRIRMMRGDEFANRRLQLSHAAMDAPPCRSIPASSASFTVHRTHVVAPSDDGTHVTSGWFKGTMTSPRAAR